MIYNLHGNLGSQSDWINFPGQAVDLWESSSEPLWEWAFDFCKSAREREPVSNFLVGYSMGGRLALHALIAEPDLWSGAVIISAHPGLCCVEDRMARRTSDAVWAEWARDWDWSSFLEKWNGQAVLSDSTPSATQLELKSRREAIAEGFENWSLGIQEDLRDRLSKVTPKVLWVTGELDAKFSAIGKEMAEIIPNCEHLIVENCGHRVIFEKPGFAAEIVRDFCVFC